MLCWVKFHKETGTTCQPLEVQDLCDPVTKQPDTSRELKQTTLDTCRRKGSNIVELLASEDPVLVQDSPTKAVLKLLEKLTQKSTWQEDMPELLEQEAPKAKGDEAIHRAMFPSHLPALPLDKLADFGQWLQDSLAKRGDVTYIAKLQISRFLGSLTLKIASTDILDSSILVAVYTQEQ
eukprot:811050-Amphidinium_carterae.2